MKHYLLLLLCISLASCYTSRKAGHQVAHAQSRHPLEVAKACALFYPVKEYDSIRTIVKEGETIPGPVQYVTIDCDSVIRSNSRQTSNASTGAGSGNNSGFQSNRNQIRIECPPATHKVDTIFTEHYKQVENTAALYVARDSTAKANIRAAKAEDKTDRVTKTRNKLWIAAIAGWGLILGGIALRFMKPRLLS